MKRYIAPLLIGLLGAAILLWLGTWQISRLDWKRGILDDIETTIASDPKPLPRLIDPDAQRYQPVALRGEIGDEALAVLVSVKQRGAGWRLISAFQTDDGRRVLLDRGFAPVDQKDAPLYAGPAEVTGNLHWPDDRNSSTPDNDPAGNTWFARDLAPMAEVLDTEPLLVVARQMSPADKGVTPLPVDTSGIPNDHLQYAITWYSLAAVWLIMTGAWIWRLRTGREA
ncbi:SURF1 family protein [Mameliella sediminis]|uniref:SURF1 family protein n=1 Tax=Mameliella sediminis TaxID=2836866 RepID=UPI001C44F95F|nr:SURF1 family protein [Mameliella sediminis]MBV7396677.1 SURF1 family protein [Mameliella sediminis]